MRNVYVAISAHLVELPTEKQVPDKGKFCLESNLLSNYGL